MSNETDFSIFIEKMALERKMSRWDTMIQYCAENFIDPIEVLPNIGKSLIAKFELELQEEGRLPKSTTNVIS